MKKLIPGLITGALILSISMLPAANLEVSAAAGQTLFINEIMAANTSSIRDGDTASITISDNSAPASTGYKVSGYIKPSFSTTNNSLYSNFKVVVTENGNSTITDSNGYFEIPDAFVGQSVITLKISKTGYLTRTVSNISAQGNISLGTTNSPVEIWAGDIAQDETINMSDVIKIANSFNAITGDAKYLAAADINMNGSINMEDVIALAMKFGKTFNDYPAVTPVIVPTTTATTTTSAPTPTPTAVNPEDAWKLNTGTINLGSSITYTGTGIQVNGSVVNITAGGDHTVKGTLSNGMIYVNTTEKVKLRLSGANITNSNGPAIYCQNADKLFITIEGDTTNTLSDGTAYSDQNAKGTIFSNDDLEIKGNGTLNITANYNHAISGDDDIVIENGIINVKSAVNDGIHSNGALNIKGGTLNITATKDALQSEEEEILIEGGTLNLSAGSQGLISDTGVTINAGDIKVTKCNEGIQTKLTNINGGSLYIESTDDSLNSSMGTRTEANDGSQLNINGGSVYLSATKGDTIDSNGNAKITGGTVAVHGSTGEPGADVNGTFTVSGGLLIITASNNSMNEYPTGASSQYTIATMLTTAQAANTNLCIKDSTGKALVMFKPKRNFYSIVFSSPELKQGSTYSIYTGGTVSGGTEINSLITGGTYSGGTAVSTITVTTSPTTAVNWKGSGFPR
jgi:hypothetical protein